jgi:hypothetical protein
LRSKDGPILHPAHNPKVVSSNLTPATNYLNPRPGIRRPAFSFVAGSSPKSRAVIFLCAPQTTRDAGRRSSSGSNLTPATNFLFVYKGFLNSNRKPFLLWAKLRAKNSGLLCSKLLEAADAVILETSLGRVDELIHIARRMRHIALQSAIGGMALSILGMFAAAFGYLPPIGGAITQEIIDLAAVLNAVRVALPTRSLTDF